MFRVILIAIALIGLTACNNTQKGAVIGGASGAAIGAATTGEASGALVGGAVGAAAGALIGRATEPGKCVYRDAYGREYIANC
ncbi:YMGG-like glycine zipper-containing protein [Roseibium salinum]|uniref:Glycine zipper domain-containing protein n=1 Tax=Roseibium salinum TaxID=1604349 RepID=A0ABT3R7R4_9HYPH|nr:YMGG-like glycine zipper-containing protein [Roseibium sp. DSM 29163]MCX2725189.1 glycine zipper domain-containing protein [Roseibium sp. DSM 29163]